MPEDRVRGRYARVPGNVIDALPSVDRLFVIDNSEEGRAFRTVLAFDRGSLTYRSPDLPRAIATLFGDAITDD